MNVAFNLSADLDAALLSAAAAAGLSLMVWGDANTVEAATLFASGSPSRS